MSICGRKINDHDMEAFSLYMNDEIREQVHAELAPCAHEVFLQRYIELDPDFEELLKHEFNVEL